MLGKKLKSWNFSPSVFLLHFNFAYLTKQAAYNDRHASGDCGTSGSYKTRSYCTSIKLQFMAMPMLHYQIGEKTRNFDLIL